jgi:anti-sigma regulatory factor (Ser/Thr protein kinase)
VADRTDAPAADGGAAGTAVAASERRSGAWRFPVAGTSVRAVRRALRPFLADAELPADEVEDLVLAACEAAANAVEHAVHPTEHFFDLTAETDDGRVEIVVRDYGRWRTDRTPSRDEGHGLLMMSTLAAVTLTSGPFGTTVTLRRLRL